MESMSMSQQSQPNEDVSPAMGEMYMLFQWIPNDEESNRFQSNKELVEILAKEHEWGGLPSPLTS